MEGDVQEYEFKSPIPLTNLQKAFRTNLPSESELMKEFLRGAQVYLTRLVHAKPKSRRLPPKHERMLGKIRANVVLRLQRQFDPRLTDEANGRNALNCFLDAIHLYVNHFQGQHPPNPTN